MRAGSRQAGRPSPPATTPASTCSPASVRDCPQRERCWDGPEDASWPMHATLFGPALCSSRSVGLACRARALPGWPPRRGRAAALWQARSLFGQGFVPIKWSGLQENALHHQFFFLITHDCTQVQILHEYDTCCFSPHDRHDGTLRRGRCLPFCAVFCGRLQKNIANNGFFNNNANNEFLMQLYI
jgi:hypothetical protein